MVCCFCSTLFERFTCRNHRRRRAIHTRGHKNIVDGASRKSMPMRRISRGDPKIEENIEDVKAIEPDYPQWPTWDDKPETERYIHEKPVASVSPLPNQTSQNEDSEQAIALYDFAAQHEDELSFSAGDRLLVTSRCDQDWLYGCALKDSKYGIFPASFVQIGSESGSETESLKEIESNCENLDGAEGAKKPIQTTTKSSDGRPVIAIFAFSPEQEGDLGFEEGETISVLSRINKDWLMGRNARGEVGQFPAGFVQLTDTTNSQNSTTLADSNVYVCIFDFEAQQTDDLTIRAGDKIRVTEKISEEWWQGHVLGDKREGIFPSNFVEPL
ncbi:SH3 domain-containing protein 19 [Galendromus occidentalis]|uniref:SH3 domain-containing protein 19 n=1 Tax=Galendromus occidentalis TaxID=34638 RepID=A0AAJ6QTK3_9ACAR|nr:SH3 domain-containing protein 19 [Galendromus occidentalis]